MSFRLLGLLMGILAVPLLVFGAGPGWWSDSQPPVLVPGATPNDYAAVNQGQVKNLAKAAVRELDAHLPGGAGAALHALAEGWSTGSGEGVNDYAAVNLGQLKALAKPFYDRLIAEGVVEGYPWVGPGKSPDDYAVANIGQVKNLFSFDLLKDGDDPANGLPDWWEERYFGASGVNKDADPDGDGQSNLAEYAGESDPENFYSQPGGALTVEIAKVGGDEQVGEEGAYLEGPLVVEVRNGENELVENAPVVFSVQSGGGGLALEDGATETSSEITVRTGEDGRASLYYRQGSALDVESQIKAQAGEGPEVGFTCQTGSPRLEVTPGEATIDVSAGEQTSLSLNLLNHSNQAVNYGVRFHGTIRSTELSHEGDAFGYRWASSKDVDGPTYIWNDISSTGTLLSAISSVDNGSLSVALPFNFPFYGQLFSEAFVCSNGHISFGEGSLDHQASGLPSVDRPARMISALHKDLDTATSGEIYYQTDAEKAIIQFENVSNHSGGGAYTFQIVLHKNGSINFYYKEINGTVNNATVGIQNATKDTGFAIGYGSTFLESNLAILISNLSQEWLVLSPAPGSLAGQADISHALTIDASKRPAGDYVGQVEFYDLGETMTSGTLALTIHITPPSGSGGGEDGESKVATPEFSIPGGILTRYSSVSLSCATPEATIRYTTDGTEPTVYSPVYTAPISLGTTMTIKARAWCSGLSPSNVVSEKYMLAGKVVAGLDSAFAISLDGSVWAWGNGGDGKLGDGSATTRTSPVPLAALSDIVDIASAVSHSAAVKADGTLWTWGSNDIGQLGNGTTNGPVYTPASISGINDAIAVAAGNQFTLVLRSTDRAIYACGRGKQGRLGNGLTGTVKTLTTPVKLLSTGATLTGVTAIAAGEQHGLALDENGHVWAWGYNGDGRLGDGTTTDRNMAVPVINSETGLPLENIVAIDSQSAHTVAVDAAGYAWAWGKNTGGQLGDGTSTSRPTAVRMKVDEFTYFTGAVGIAAGIDFTLVTKADGTLWASGQNTNGSLGIGSTTKQVYLKQVLSGGEPLTDIALATAGRNFGVGLTRNGQIYTWGNAESGHLGNGTTSPSITSAKPLESPYLGNHPPEITLSVSGGLQAPADDVALSATPTDADGDDLKVDFYFGDVLIGTCTQPPYQIDLASLGFTKFGVGRYGFRAVATDTYGATARATAYHTVNPPVAALGQVFFRRGLEIYLPSCTTVVALGFEKGTPLSPAGFDSATFSGEMPWFTNISFKSMRQFLAWVNESQFYYQTFENPIVAFGASAGGSPLYKNQPYRIGVQMGANPKDSNGNYVSVAKFKIDVYNKTTGDYVATKFITLPIAENPSDSAKWESFVRNGFVWPTPEYPDSAFYGLETKIQMISLSEEYGGWGSSYPGYILTQQSDSEEYGYVISAIGFVPKPSTSSTQFISMTWDPEDESGSIDSKYAPMYTLDFTARAPWQSEMLKQPSFSGQPMPSQYIGKTLDELLNVQNSIDIPLTLTPASYLKLNHSPELRRHSTLDQLTSDLTTGLGNDTEKALALSNFVLNEIELSEPLGYNEEGDLASTSINPGGVQRSAYATYMEGQGSAPEQCALLVYLLRQAGIPAVYLYPQQDKLLMLDARLSSMFGFQVKGLLNQVGEPMTPADSDRPSLIPVNYPWVAAYVDGRWVHIFPWIKDIEVDEGYDLYSLMPEGYKNAHQWTSKYLACDPEIEDLIADNDTPAVVFPKFVEKVLRENHPGLTIDDVGVRIHQRKHYFSSLDTLPKPFALSETPSVVESLKDKPNIFDTIRIKVSAVNGVDSNGNYTSARKMETAEMPLLELFNRKLLIYQTKASATVTNVKLIMSPFDKGISGTDDFDGSFSTMAKRQEKSISTGIYNTTADKFLQVSFTIKRQRSFTLPSGIGKWDVYMGLVSPSLVEQSALLGKGDLAGVCINYGRVTNRMLNVYAQEFWSNQGKSDISPEIYAGTPVYLMGMSYYKKLSDFGPVNYHLHKALMLNSFGVGLSVLGAERNDSGNLDNGDITLNQPYVDMFIKRTAGVGNNTLHPDSGDEDNFGALLNASVMYVVDGSAQEHAVINQFYSKSDSISTIELLRIAKKDPGTYPNTYYILNKSNYLQYDSSMSALDSSMWKTIKDRFESDGDHLTVYITSEKVTGAAEKYTGMGALLLGRSQFSGLISKNLNGGYSSHVSSNMFSSSNSSRLSLNISNTSYDSHYSISSLPSFTSPAPSPVSLSLSSVSYNSIYPVIDQGYQNAFSFSPVQTDYWSTVGDTLDLGFTSTLTSADYGAGVAAVRNQGYLGVSSFIGAVLNWVADPVNVMTGAYYHDETDLSLPGSMPLEIRRSYNSRNIGDGEFGYGWKISMVPYLVMPAQEGSTDSDPVINPSSDIYAAEMDGSVIVYSRVGSTNVWVPTLEKNPQMANIWGEKIGAGANVRNAKIVRTGTSQSDTTYTLTSADGNVRVFKIKSYPIPGTLPSGVERINRKRAYLETWSDNRGNTFSFALGEDNTQPDYGLLKRVTSGNGMFIGFNYDTFGHITEAYTSDGRWVYYGYSQYGDLESVTRPDGSVFRYEYLLESAEVDGKTEWTSKHLITRAIKPEGRILENDYDSENRVVTQRATVGEGNALVVNGTFEYTNTEDPDDKTLSGHTVAKDAFERATRYDYNHSQITQITDPLGQTTSHEWYGDSENTGGAYPRSIKRITDPRGLVRTYTYDTAGNLVSTATTGDLKGDGTSATVTTTTTYNERNLPVESVDASGNRTVLTYGDPAQPYLPTFVERFAGAVSINRTVREYGTAGSGAITAKGVLTREIAAQGTGDEAIVEYEYDSRGYPTKTTRYTGTDDPAIITLSRYNLRGELVEETDALGRKNAYAYDAQGRRIWEERTDENGLLFWWNYTYYNGNGEVTWTDGPRFEPEDYVWRRYDGGGRLIEESSWRSQAKEDGSGVEAPAGVDIVSTVINQYNAFGDLLKTVDPRGNATTMEYDAVGRMTKQQRHEGSSDESTVLSTESYTYEPGGEVATHTNALGGVTQNEYTATGKLKRQQQPDGTVTQWRYQLDGRLASETQPNGNTWTVTYNDAARSVTRTLKDPAGTLLAVETQRYDRRGNLIETTDAEGNVYSASYDDLNRVKTRTGPAASTSAGQRRLEYHYDIAGKRESVSNALGESTTTTRDALGRPVLVEVKNGSSETVSQSTCYYRPDHHSYLLTQGTGSGAVTSEVWTDTQGHQVLTTHADGSFRINRYDPAGNLLSSTDEEGRTTTQSYDALGRLAQEQRPGGEQIGYSYNAAGNLTGRTLPGGITWEATYDNATRKLSEKLKNGTSESRNFTYSYLSSGVGIGQLGSVNDPRGIVKTYSYDPRSRLQSVVTTGTAPEANLTLAYQYDKLNRLTRLEQSGQNGNADPGSIVEVTRGAYGEILEEEVGLGGATHFAYQQSWDAAGRRISLQPTGEPTKAQSFAWRADGLLVSTGIGSTAFTYSYGNQGLMINRSGANRSRSIATRDNRGRPTSVITEVGTTEALAETLTWRDDSKLTNYSATRNGTGAWNEERAYSYDASGRLTTEPYTLTTGTTAQLAYAFDHGTTGGLGVRTLADITGAQSGQWQVPSGKVDAFGRVIEESLSGITGSGTKTTSYDAAGNAIERTLPGGKTQVLKWDGLGRLVKVEERDASENGYNWSAIYDGLGRRLKTSYQPVVVGVESGTAAEVASAYDPEVEFLEIETRQGSNTWRKLYGPDGEGQYGQSQGVGGLEAVLASGGAVSVPIMDCHGNVEGWLDGAGGVDYSATTRSLSYGPAPGATSTVLELNPGGYMPALAWQGRRIDPTGMIWLGARYYEPESGRFLSTDPMGNASSLSLYDYCGGDPVNRLDPDGRFARGAFGAVKSIVSGAARLGYNIGGGIGYLLGTSYASDYENQVAELGRMAVGIGRLTYNVGGELAYHQVSLLDAVMGTSYAQDIYGEQHAGMMQVYSGLTGGSGNSLAYRAGYTTVQIASLFLPGKGASMTADAAEVSSVVRTAAKTTGQLALPNSSVVPNAGGVIRSFLQKTDQIYYRVSSGSPSGSFLTAVKPRSSAWAREALALPKQNTASFIQEVLVPAGTRLQRSRTLPAFGRRGGAEQFEILKLKPGEYQPVQFGENIPFQ